ncbi:MAG: hypothetical protein ACRENA_12585 [Vulcanimicrobiaceae bacterium]
MQADSKVKVPINPVVAVIPIPPPAAQADLQSGGGSMASALAQAVQESQGTTVLANTAASVSGLDAISLIAANAGVKPKPRALPREEAGKREPVDEKRASQQERVRRNPLLNLF